jgi:hypothetical protein
MGKRVVVPSDGLQHEINDLGLEPWLDAYHGEKRVHSITPGASPGGRVERSSEGHGCTHAQPIFFAKKLSRHNTLVKSTLKSEYGEPNSRKGREIRSAHAWWVLFASLDASQLLRRSHACKKRHLEELCGHDERRRKTTTTAATQSEDDTSVSLSAGAGIDELADLWLWCRISNRESTR